ncbi:hypothetical protein, partial [Streptomyces sp. NPDC058728]|uniref:hypothetical protein n=1 Tax=Streptomyces sp. NPDC058728 TaxID=3346612 RepID=UPI0036CEA8BF
DHDAVPGALQGEGRDERRQRAVAGDGDGQGGPAVCDPGGAAVAGPVTGGPGSRRRRDGIRAA